MTPKEKHHTVVHKKITYTETQFLNLFLPGYNYNYIKNCREKLSLHVPVLPMAQKHQLQLHTYIIAWRVICVARLQLQLHELFLCK